MDCATTNISTLRFSPACCRRYDPSKPATRFPEDPIFLEPVTDVHLCVDAAACIVTAYPIDPGLDGEGIVLGRDSQTDFHEPTAVIGRMLAHAEAVKTAGALDLRT